MTMPPEEQPQSKLVIDAVATQMVQVTQVYVNVAQQLIVTTEDKVRLCLNERMQNIEKRGEWTTPAGILLTLLVTFPTTVFREFLLSKETWEAVFIVAAFLALGWLLRCFRRRPKAQSVDDVLNQMKQGTVVQPSAKQP
jgi:hypothetical protein